MVEKAINLTKLPSPATKLFTSGIRVVLGIDINQFGLVSITIATRQLEDVQPQQRGERQLKLHPEAQNTAGGWHTDGLSVQGPGQVHGLLGPSAG